nr:reverse transcriptase domain-containing protein [Tanacetum cinerariifolium]
MAAEGNGDLPVPDLRTIVELCQPSLNGRGGPIAPIAIQATNFGLKNDMIQQSIKVNEFIDDALCLYLFPHSLTHHATVCMRTLQAFNRCLNHNTLPVTQIDTFYNGLTLRHRDTINAAGGTFMKRRPEECYDLIENMTAHHNDWDRSVHFSADFVVVDFDADPRVPLILGRSFLKTERALIDVYEGDLTLRVGKEAMTFNLAQTSRYSTNYDAMSVNQIDLFDVACEEYSQEVFGFFVSRNPTPSTEPIVSNSSPTLTPFRETPLPPQELKVVELTNKKSSIDEPPVVELKDLPPHLEYAFLEGDDKLRVIIAKDLKDKEKTALIKRFITREGLIKKIHRVIKKDVLKLLDARLIYPISDSPWVSPVHCVPKKGGFTVVENEKNELIPTRLVTGWRVCIDYQKLNDATRKDHFPLIFMDQMLERLTRNEYYCFLDGFSGYFQIPIDPQDQEKTTFTCPYGTFAYHRMPFGLCNAPGMFQRCVMDIFHDMIKKIMEVFMDDFSVFGNSFETCLSYLDKMLKRCEDTNLCLN